MTGITCKVPVYQAKKQNCRFQNAPKVSNLLGLLVWCQPC